MPNQNQPDPKQESKQPVNPPVMFPQSDLPPLPPEFMSVDKTNETKPATSPIPNTPTENGPVAPPPNIPPTVSKPKRNLEGEK